MKTEFYTCDVCGGELDPKGPCHRAVEVSYPDAYLPSYEISLASERRSRYICPGCLPLRNYRRTTPKQTEIKTTLWNLLVKHLRGES